MKKLIILTILSSSILATTNNKLLLDWTNQNITQLVKFSYFHDENKYWDNFKNIFTNQGWQNFQHDIKDARTIGLIKKYQLTCQLEIDKEHESIQKINNNSWQINTVALITYAGEKTASKYKSKIKIIITKNNNKILIDKFNFIATEFIKQTKIYPRGCNLRKYK